MARAGAGWHLVLDWDRTLAHADEDSAIDGLPSDGYTAVYDKYVFLRPGLGEFLAAAFADFDTVSLWTHASEEYIIEMTAILERRGWVPRPFHRILHDGHAMHDVPVSTRPYWNEVGPAWYKPLAPAGFSRHRTIIVDDTEQNATFNPLNAITIPPYKPPERDDALPKLTQYFRRVLPTIRAVHELPDRHSIFDSETDEFVMVHL